MTGASMRHSLIVLATKFLALMLVAVQGVYTARAAEPVQKEPAKKVDKQQIIKISKETTRITAPLDADGFPDYLQALENRSSKGATPENNFEVVVRTVMPPNEILEELREEYFKRIGIPVPDKQTRFYRDFISLNKSGRDDKAIFEEHGVISSQPWVAAKHPAAAKWVITYRKDLDRLVEGSKRAKYYTPYLTGEPDENEPMPTLISILLPSIHQHREIARGLSIRAMGRIGEGNLEGAWSDLQAIRRVARLVGQGSTLIENLVAIAVDSLAFQGEVHVLNSPKLTDEQTARFLTDLKSLPTLPPMADKIDVGERFMGLDTVTSLARNSRKHGLIKMLQLIQALSFVTELGGATSLVTTQNPVERMIATTTDWNVTLKVLNEWYDKLVAASREPDFQKRKARFQAIEQDLAQLRAETIDTKALLKLLLTRGPRKALGEKIGGILVALLLPAINAARAAEDGATASMTVMQLGFALELHRRDHGSLPKSLDGLVPRYVKSIKLDPLSGNELKYVVTTGGFMIYSVGRNGVDDKGRTYSDAEREATRPKWDDIVVRVGK